MGPPVAMVQGYRPISETNGLVIAVEWPIAVASNSLDVSPTGVLDMADNAAEWTTTIWGEPLSSRPAFSYPYRADDGRENLDSSSKLARVIRGASGKLPLARCFDRDDHEADYGTFRFRDPVGFRVVCPSTQNCADSPWVAPSPAEPAPTPTVAASTQSRVNPKDGVLYLQVPAGEFTSGVASPIEEDVELRQEPVFLEDFWISRIRDYQPAVRRLRGSWRLHTTP